MQRRITPMDQLCQTVIQAVPERFFLECEQVLLAAAVRAGHEADRSDLRQQPYIRGQLRHGLANSGFTVLLRQLGCEPWFLGNGHIVVGRFGSVHLARLNITGSDWRRARKSSGRKLLAQMNEEVARACSQPDLFQPADLRREPEMTVFLVSFFGYSAQTEPDTIHVVIPGPRFESLLLSEPLDRFCRRYDAPVIQPDQAHPKLKRHVRRKPGNGTSDASP